MFTTFILSRTGDSSALQALYALLAPMENPFIPSLTASVDVIKGDYSGVIIHTDKPITDMVTDVIKTCFEAKAFKVYKWPHCIGEKGIMDYLKSQE